MTWIQTYDGQAFDIMDPRPESIDPRTIATALSRMCRFGGHCKEFYSVAQHSALVCDLVADPELKLPALLHDAHECYWGFGDICKPAKWCLDAPSSVLLNSIQSRVDIAIADRFGFDPALFHSPEVKQADVVALFAEQRDLMLPAPRPWSDSVDCSHVKTIVPVWASMARKRFWDALDVLMQVSAKEAVAP